MGETDDWAEARTALLSAGCCCVEWLRHERQTHLSAVVHSEISDAWIAKFISSLEHPVVKRHDPCFPRCDTISSQSVLVSRQFEQGAPDSERSHRTRRALQSLQATFAPAVGWDMLQAGCNPELMSVRELSKNPDLPPDMDDSAV